MISGVPSDDVETMWPWVMPFVMRYLDKSREHRWNAVDIKDMLLERDLQLWLIHNGDAIKTVVLTQLVNYPRVRECNIFMVCGELLDDWRECNEYLLSWAAEHGCHYASAMARKGFAKAVGWDERQVYVVRAL